MPTLFSNIHIFVPFTKYYLSDFFPVINHYTSLLFSCSHLFLRDIQSISKSQIKIITWSSNTCSTFIHHSGLVWWFSLFRNLSAFGLIFIKWYDDAFWVLTHSRFIYVAEYEWNKQEICVTWLILTWAFQGKFDCILEVAWHSSIFLLSSTNYFPICLHSSERQTSFIQKSLYFM